MFALDLAEVMRLGITVFIGLLSMAVIPFLVSYFTVKR
ncbi:MAG: hypothetical protein UY40_C0006G0023 [candidate division CPR1 bacterium GW2011_GWC1_49_13]|uniref:Uncharacterized protein n=1 Tax=candidate division CPR1 bacterium GW2011_GWC1_49_13 TaxID=1618342 RepID=A0A0G1YHP9_9BACT|nr:MAG: hypothetical protein UY40_C0006G0023 [candidate division CPR1 bacterium GW2011_GWC1_49_13]